MRLSSINLNRAEKLTYFTLSKYHKSILSQVKLESLDTGMLFLKSLRKRLMEKRCYLMGCNDSSS